MAFHALVMLRSDWVPTDVVDDLRDVAGVEEAEACGEYVAWYAALRLSWCAFAWAAMVEKTLDGIVIVVVVVVVLLLLLLLLPN